MRTLSTGIIITLALLSAATLGCEPGTGPALEGTAPAPAGHLAIALHHAAPPESDVPAAGVAVLTTPKGETVTLHGAAPVRFAVLDPAGRFAATVGVDRSLRVTPLPAREPDPTGAHLADGVFEAPVFSPAHTSELLFAATSTDAEGNALFLLDASGRLAEVVGAGAHNDRAAFSPDGTDIAFVSDRTGIPAVFVLHRASGDVEQLTNNDLRRVPGRAPDGYVPPPVDGPLRWTDAGIAYDGPTGLVTLSAGRRP